MILQFYDKRSMKMILSYVHLLAGEKGANVHHYTFVEVANVLRFR